MSRTLGEPDGLGLVQRRVRGFEGPQRVGQPALILSRRGSLTLGLSLAPLGMGERLLDIVLIVGQLGRVVVIRIVAIELLLEAVHRRTRPDLGQGKGRAPLPASKGRAGPSTRRPAPRRA